jgi:cytochrome c-type biogenesis protein CcmH
VLTSLSVLLAAALVAGAAAFWVLRAYRQAGGGERSAAPALMICGVVAVAALGVYMAIGRPELRDAPYQERLEALKQRDPATYSADEAIAVLLEAAKDRPRDALPHFYMGQVLLGQGRAEEAARAFDAALRREPELAEAMLGLGRAMVAIENGRITPEALALFQQAGALMDDPVPWIYQAMAAMDEGRDADSRRLWGEALRRMPEDDPRRQMAQEMSSGAGR